MSSLGRQKWDVIIVIQTPMCADVNYGMSDDHHVILPVPTICRLAPFKVYIYLQRFRDFWFFRQF